MPCDNRERRMGSGNDDKNIGLISTGHVTWHKRTPRLVCVDSEEHQDLADASLTSHLR